MHRNQSTTKDQPHGEEGKALVGVHRIHVALELAGEKQSIKSHLGEKTS
jgi:hypothetical protein